jgi:hypothetical protein
VVGKPVINPSYLHKNKTVFDNSGAVYDANSNDETLEIIRKMKSGTLSESSVDAKSQILSSEVYLDLETADCATKYKDAVLALI